MIARDLVHELNKVNVKLFAPLKDSNVEGREEFAVCEVAYNSSNEALTLVFSDILEDWMTVNDIIDDIVYLDSRHYNELLVLDDNDTDYTVNEVKYNTVYWEEI